ncbi:hydroxymethylglutaryl-CoA lyase [uncultured Parasphingorhabdus sp.]|uniref:hydroxymethylglutaryl-CoA lyase n=1 Tax=uncultured Parasphingorhabdus sp. TaxID=2709694 RepID=UPI002AA7D963|nr:hydroxymethylglutaryl-CoA lyase [uncultured Parasphingorhabdus sp.]
MNSISSVEIVEVSPRDGLQNESQYVSTMHKLTLIARAINAGSRRIEVASFVNPRAVPQMADAEKVCAGLPENDEMTYIGLVMNHRGAERALATGRINQLGVVAVATDTFAMANQGQTSNGSVEIAKEIISLAHSKGITAQATIAASFGCPFEGEVMQERVVEMVSAIFEAGPVEIALADTIGVGNPAHVASLINKIRDVLPSLPIRVHFHNTRGTGIANVWAAICAGAATVDASIGGLGGCPFASGAAGNVATEDVTYMLERAGIQTGLDIDKLLAANEWLASLMDKPLASMMAKAGSFPASKQDIKEYF